MGLAIIKYGVFFASLVIMITGATVTTISGLFAYAGQEVESSARKYDDLLFFGEYVLVISGSLMFYGGIVGCLGAIKKSSFLLSWFLSFVLVTLLVWLSYGVYLYLNQEILTNLRTQMKSFAQQLLGAQDYYITLGRDLIQNKMECCGATGLKDYTFMVPKSCCYGNLTEVQCEVARNASISDFSDSESIYKEGCIEKLTDWMKLTYPLIFGGAIGSAIVLVLGLLFTVYLIKCYWYKGYLVNSRFA